MSEDPFYCGETFESESSTREKIWRFRTEEEMIERHGYDWMEHILDSGVKRKQPDGNDYHWTGVMRGLLGKPLSDFTFVRPYGGDFKTIDFNPAEDTRMLRFRNTLSKSPKTWMVSPKDDFIYDYPV
jgi:hypothetical protein